MEKFALIVQLFAVFRILLWVGLAVWIFWVVTHFVKFGKEKKKKEEPKKERRFIFLTGENDDGPWVKEVCQLSLEEDENEVLKKYKKKFKNELYIIEGENRTEAAVKLLKLLKQLKK